MDLVMAQHRTLNLEKAAHPTDSALLQSRFQSVGTITFMYTESYLTSKSRKCVIPVVCVKLGKWYVVKHNCVTCPIATK